MAVATIPKSEMRQVTSISVGFGEIPMIIVDGRPAWGLPGRSFTFHEEEALAAAIKLDSGIRQLLSRGKSLEPR